MGWFQTDAEAEAVRQRDRERTERLLREDAERFRRQEEGKRQQAERERGITPARKGRT